MKSSLTYVFPVKAARANVRSVDVATYKAEFLAHHFEKKRRPVAHHILGG